MTIRFASRLTIPVASVLLVAAASAPAAGHVDIIGAAEVEPGADATIGFRIPHGCGELATDTVSVRMPEGLTGVQAEWVPGFEVTMEEDGVRIGVVTWSGGSLPTDLFYDFRIRATFPDAEMRLVFPVVQRCGDAEQAWIQTAETVAEGEALEFPAPFITLSAAGAASGHDHGDGEDHADGADDGHDHDEADDTKKDRAKKAKKKKADDGHDHDH